MGEDLILESADKVGVHVEATEDLFNEQKFRFAPGQATKLVKSFPNLVTDPDMELNISLSEFLEDSGIKVPKNCRELITAVNYQIGNDLSALSNARTNYDYDAAEFVDSYERIKGRCEGQIEAFRSFVAKAEETGIQLDGVDGVLDMIEKWRHLLE